MLETLYYITIYPIQLIIEILFNTVYYWQIGIGLTIFVVSLFVNLGSLPMFISAYKLQKKERDIQEKMAPKVKSIKANFKGVEKFMILSTYYRQNNYHPIMSLRTSLSLLLQIPFFTAAYLFFSHLDILNGMNCWIIKDLSLPDGLLKINDLSINVLPILMTVFNLISCEIYMKGFKFKEKLQMYGLALVFLVILYNSPSGLVLYWTFNNLISVVRSFVIKQKNKRMLISALIFFTIILFFIQIPSKQLHSILMFLLNLSAFIITFLICLKYILKRNYDACDYKQITVIFLLSCIVSWVLIGLLIPSNLAASSPFTFATTNSSPIRSIYYPMIQSLGIFVFWAICFYLFMNKYSIKIILSFFSLNIVFYSVLNIITIPSMGKLTENFQFFNGVSFTTRFEFTNLILSLIITIFLSLLIYRKKFKFIIYTISIILMASCILTSINIYNSNKNYSRYINKILKPTKKLTPVIHLSKEKQNVVIFMMDKQINSFLPMIFNEDSDLKNLYTGFKYYPNTISYYAHTILGLPPILGGYEYIPENLEKRKDKVVDKRNEAVFMLPLLFKNNNWNCLLTDLAWIDFKDFPDGKRFEKYKLNYEYIAGRYSQLCNEEFHFNLNFTNTEVRKVKFLLFDFFVAIPHIFKKSFYDNGTYCSLRKNLVQKYYSKILFDSFATLYYLPDLTDFSSDKNSFVYINNNFTHDPLGIKVPNKLKFIDNFKDSYSADNYITNYTAFLLIGNFIDYLKKNNVYDNTRIIIVSDHGAILVSNPNFSDFLNKNLMPFNPILFVKDFNAKGEYTTDYTFMTNADVPLIATKNVIKNPINPFTNKPLIDEEKRKGAMIFISHDKFNPSDFNGTKIFDKNSKFNFVKDNVFDENNWVLDYKYQEEK